MQSHIDKEISSIEIAHLQHQNSSLQKQNSLLKAELQQIHTIHSQTLKELDLYRHLFLKQSTSDDVQILEFQHSKIFELETQLDLVRSKNEKLTQSMGSKKETQYALKCKQYETTEKEKEVKYQKEIKGLKDKLMRYEADQLMQKKRLATFSNSESQEVKTTLGYRKLV